MKVFYLPPVIKALVFDMDLTLYTNPEYGQFQIDSLVERMGKRQGLSFEEMKGEIEERRRTWPVSHSGVKPSLSNVLMSYGISMEENILWREEIYEPKEFLKEDGRLAQTLEELSSSFILGVVTNNSVLVAHKTLAALGIEKYITILVGLDTCMVAKPHLIPYEKFSELSLCPPGTCVSIGDRFEIDLDIPLEMGMGGILVDGVEDVYELPGVLLKKN